jgi:hypothetical protein
MRRPDSTRNVSLAGGAVQVQFTGFAYAMQTSSNLLGPLLMAVPGTGSAAFRPKA